jgi:Fe-S-cluster containining protein
MNPSQELLAGLNADKSPAAIRRGISRYYEAADANSDAFLKTKGLSLACRQSCALCCVFRVHVRAHEVFAIVNYIASKFSAQEREELIVRLKKHSERIAPMTRVQHETTNVPCPLLVDSACSVYPVRPLGCRRHHSTDVSACQYSHDHPEDVGFVGARDPAFFSLWSGMTSAAHQAYETAGFDAEEYELGTAILSALQNPASARRWRDCKSPLLAPPRS